MRKLRKKFTQSLMALAATGLLLTAVSAAHAAEKITYLLPCLLYTSPSPRDS